MQAGQASCALPVTAGDVNRMLESLPGIAHDAPLSAKVVEECRKWLLQHYADVRDVITREELRSAFRNLHAHAVILYMECDSLIGTENDLAILITCWHAGEWGKAAKEEHLVALSRLLRLGNLAPSILESALPELPWFKEGRLLRPFVHTFRRYGSSCVQLYPTLGIPPAWVAPARRSAGQQEAQQPNVPEPLVWRLPVEAVTEMSQSEAISFYASPVLYSNGVFFRAYLRPRRPSMELRLSVELTGSHGVPVPPALDVSLSIKQHRLPPHGSIKVVNEDVLVLVSASRLSWTMPVPSAEIIRLYPEVIFDGHLVFDILLQPK